ncbi:MAG: cupin domain-containing protein [Egibacteraceae bacterium]
MTSQPPSFPDPVPVDLRDYVVFQLERPAGRRVFTSQHLGLDLICLEPGQVMAPRTLIASDAVYTVLGGQAWLVTDEAEVTLGPLQAVFVPAGVPHGVRNESADPLILQVVGAPPPRLKDDDEGAPVQRVPTTDDDAQPPAEEPTTAHPAGPPRRGVLDRVRRLLGSGA